MQPTLFDALDNEVGGLLWLAHVNPLFCFLTSWFRRSSRRVFFENAPPRSFILAFVSKLLTLLTFASSHRVT